MISRSVSLLPVVAYDEIVLGTNVEPVETISLKQLENKDQKDQELSLV